MNKEIIEIKVEKIDNKDFIDEEIETLEKYIDKKTGGVLGYYKPEIYYAPHNAERITEEEFFKNLGIKKIKNNYDKIKQMSVNEMAVFLATSKPRACFLCTGQQMSCLRMVSCTQGVKDYLLQEVEE